MADDRFYFRQLLAGRDFARDDQIARQMVNFVYLMVLPLHGDKFGFSDMARGIQFANEDRVGTAVMLQMFGATGAAVMAVAILISTFGCNNGLILSGARVYYAMAKDNLFFKSVGKLHPQYKTPVMPLVIGSG